MEQAVVWTIIGTASFGFPLQFAKIDEVILATGASDRRFKTNYSPAPGVVSKILVKEGDVVQSGLSVRLILILMKTCYIRGEIASEEDA